MNKAPSKYKVLGMMSGTSLDGLDLCLANYELDSSNKWSYEILAAETIPYSHEWKNSLINAPQLSAQKLIELHYKYGDFLGAAANDFLRTHNTTVDFIASHGHTIFHQPESAYTFQLGSGANLACKSKTKSISDFRTGDLAKGGQGAPLVPLGDHLLFSEFDACLNLGGIANVTFLKQPPVSFDICPVNLVLNELSQKLGFDYDKDGELAKTGVIDLPLLESLNSLPYYKSSGPKSLGREWVEEQIFDTLSATDHSAENQLRTFSEHIIIQLVKSINIEKPKSVLVTGGGAKNKYLIQLLKNKVPGIIIPNDKLIDFKEALVFGFLGILRDREEVNTLKSVTGASSDSCGGCIYFP